MFLERRKNSWNNGRGKILMVFPESRSELIVAIVEATPAGDRLRARLFLSDGSQQIIPIVLAGVRCPSASKKTGASEEVPDSTGQAEEFGDEARWFVESKLLQRNVKVEILYLLHEEGLMIVDSIKPGACLSRKLNIQLAISHNFLS